MQYKLHLSPMFELRQLSKRALAGQASDIGGRAC